MEYPKIATLLDRDEKTFKVIEDKWRCPEFEYLKDNQWVWTEKIDGTNIRVMWIPEVGIKFGGKTDNAQIPSFLLKRLQEIFTDDKMKIAFPDISVCLYGEGFGAKIQSGGKYIPNECGFILFDALVDKWWLKRDSLEDIAKKLGLPIVPIIGQGKLNDAIFFTQGGFNSFFGSFSAEGLVLKPLVELVDRKGNRIIGKIKSKDF